MRNRHLGLEQHWVNATGDAGMNTGGKAERKTEGVAKTGKLAQQLKSLLHT